jgi:hypothetical protein
MIAKGFSFTEAPASVNWRVVTPAGFNIQVTLRGEDEFELFERMKGAIQFLNESGCKPAESGVSRNISGGNEEYVGTAKELSASVTDGKTYWSIKVAPAFVKYGIRIWPEVLAEAGIVVEELSPTTVYQFEGEPQATVFIQERDGKKLRKVTKLEQCTLKGAEEQIPGF